MNTYVDSLRHKSIAIFGVSIEGYETAKYLLTHGLSITVFDQKEEKELGKIYSDLKKLGAQFSLGKVKSNNIGDFDIIFRSPGIPLWHADIMEASRRGAKISSQTKFFFDVCPCPIIGVTGTKGKGTTASLIEQILKKAGHHVELGGNIGRPPLIFLDNLYKKSWVVLELSSFQLEDLGKSPHIAVILMLTQEHLASVSETNPNYHRSKGDYLQSKARIVQFQTKNDFAVINADYLSSFSLKRETPARKLFFSRKKPVVGAYLSNMHIKLRDSDRKETVLCDTSRAKLLGLHNRENMMAAALTAGILNVPHGIIRDMLMRFPGLEHRLETIGIVHGIQYINDSFSTTPETAIAAIRAIDRSIILIVGGSEKGSDYSELGKVVANSSVHAIICIGKMGPRIKEASLKAGYTGTIMEGGKTMKDIVNQAESLANRGSVVLLSPACASYDMFVNYKERGRLFKDAVKAL